MTRILARLTVLVFAITMAISAFAASAKTDTVVLYQAAQLNGKTIPAGEYTVKTEIKGSSAQVKFLQDRKEVASASGQTKDLGKRAPYAQIVLRDGNGVSSIQELDLGGTNTGVTFDSAMSPAGQ
jgi:hypothetical protein